MLIRNSKNHPTHKAETACFKHAATDAVRLQQAAAAELVLAYNLTASVSKANQSKTGSRS
jgi:hypothetical protein